MQQLQKRLTEYADMVDTSFCIALDGRYPFGRSTPPAGLFSVAANTLPKRFGIETAEARPITTTLLPHIVPSIIQPYHIQARNSFCKPTHTGDVEIDVLEVSPLTDVRANATFTSQRVSIRLPADPTSSQAILPVTAARATLPLLLQQILVNGEPGLVVFTLLPPLSPQPTATTQVTDARSRGDLGKRQRAVPFNVEFPAPTT